MMKKVHNAGCDASLYLSTSSTKGWQLAYWQGARHVIKCFICCRRRLVKRIYIPMPDPDTRRALLKHLLSGQPAKLSRADIERLVAATHNYSGSDLAALCREAAIIPIRQAIDQVAQCHSPQDLNYFSADNLVYSALQMWMSAGCNRDFDSAKNAMSVSESSADGAGS